MFCDWLQFQISSKKPICLFELLLVGMFIISSPSQMPNDLLVSFDVCCHQLFIPPQMLCVCHCLSVDTLVYMQKLLF